jgi:O-antigen/teichoic acid export membrane protein
MSSPTIQRQSIYSTFAIITGFVLGGINMIILFPRVLSGEEFGLTRVINDFSVIAANFATLGVLPVIYKFFPLYRRYLPEGKNDLPFVALSVFISGVLVTSLLLFFFQQGIVVAFGRNNPIFPQFYWLLFPFTICYAAFLFAEPFAWYGGLSVQSNILKETVFRGLLLLLLMLLLLKTISADTFMVLFSFIFLIPAVLLFAMVKRKGMLGTTTQISPVTKRLKGKMIRFSSFIFITTVINITAVLCDTLFLAGAKGFALAAVFAIAQYASNLIEIPLRSMTGSAVPVLAEYWRAGNRTGIQSIYKKSCINLLIAGMAIGGLLLINVQNLIAFLPEAYAAIGLPILLLVIGRWINLAGGLNAQIIQTSKYLTWDFAANLILSIIAIPLNFFLIRYYGILGAATANLIVWSVYNMVRFAYLYVKFNLQPLDFKNLWTFLLGISFIAIFYLIPSFTNLYADAIWRSSLFLLTFGGAVVWLELSAEVNSLWEKWVIKKILRKP